MKISHSFLLFTTIAIGACSTNNQRTDIGSMSQPLSAKQVVARHIAATGGERNYATMRNIYIETEVVEPDFTVTGPYYAHRDGRMRVDIFMDGKRVFSEGIDETGGWQQGGEGAPVKTIGEDGNAALYRGLIQNIYGFYGAAERDQTITLAGRQTIDGVDYYVLKSVDADGFEQNYFINPENWLIERRRETSALHPDLDPTKTASEKTYSDFQEFCGLKKATKTRTVDLLSGNETQNTRILNYRCNLSDDELRSREMIRRKNVRRSFSRSPPYNPALSAKSVDFG